MPFDLSSINISDADIAYAESILLKDGECFDDERRSFIRNLKTIDLQAVPGSGKTTAILAKLLILDKKMPFPDGQGILVLSHTNIAVDELKLKLQSFAPNLFKYPNFIGTIQSFIDEFLAIPFYSSALGRATHAIDNDLYLYKFYSALGRNKKEGLIKRFSNEKTLDDFLLRIEVFNNTIFDFYTREEVIIPKMGKTAPTYIAILEIKNQLKLNGILNYNDAYYLGFEYIQRHSGVITIIKQRFPIVFIDEMQDMDIHQIEIIEKCFFDPEDPDKVILQRIGDMNQAIYSGEAKSIDSWKSRSILLLDDSRLLHIAGSHRLTPEIAKLVSNFGLEFINIEGKRISCGLKPYLIVFDDDNINPENGGTNQILGKFAKIISLQDFSGIDEKKKKFKAIVWNASPISSGYTINKCRMQHYFSEYSKIEKIKKQNHQFPKDYLKHYDKTDSTYGSIKKGILGVFIYILRGQNITYTDEKGRDHYYNEYKVIENIRTIDTMNYHIFLEKLLEWARSIKIQGDYQTVYKKMKVFFEPYLIMFGVDLKNILWREEETENELVTSLEFDAKGVRNRYTGEGVEIDITTVHSVKGETHTATLYMETSFYADRYGHGSYESERLKEQFTGNTIPTTIDSERVRQSAKMVYVGFSRPTHLLCYAIHKDRLESIGETNLSDLWEINKDLLSIST